MGTAILLQGQGLTKKQKYVNPNFRVAIGAILEDFFENI